LAVLADEKNPERGAALFHATLAALVDWLRVWFPVKSGGRQWWLFPQRGSGARVCARAWVRRGFSSSKPVRCRRTTAG
jgi:hypothetical protein